MHFENSHWIETDFGNQDNEGNAYDFYASVHTKEKQFTAQKSYRTFVQSN